MPLGSEAATPCRGGGQSLTDPSAAGIWRTREECAVSAKKEEGGKCKKYTKKYSFSDMSG
jgi:hypothetical protein